MLTQSLRPLRNTVVRRLRPRLGEAGDPWAALDTELDAWQAAGHRAAFWWRDDDAVAPTAAVQRLLRIRQTAGVPLALAVIPDPAVPALADYLRDHTGQEATVVLQHGFRHINHASRRRQPSELSRNRRRADIRRELRAGHVLLSDWPGWRPVLVPPYNDIAPRLVGELAKMGYRGLSTGGARSTRRRIPGLEQINVHIDPLIWRGEDGEFAGAAAPISEAVEHLRAKRTGTADPDEPTGLMTHCWAHDNATWDFTERFIAHIQDHAAAQWIAPWAQAEVTTPT